MTPYYILTAEYQGRKNSVTLQAENDEDAIVTASFRVISYAYPNVALWAKGAITLTDNTGRVVKTMDAKQ